MTTPEHHEPSPGTSPSPRPSSRNARRAPGGPRPAPTGRPGGTGPTRRSAGSRRAALQRRRQRRRTLTAVGAVGVVVVIIAVLVIIKAASPAAPRAVTVTGLDQPVSAAAYHQLASIRVTALANAAENYRDPYAAIPLSFPQPINGPAYHASPPAASKPGGFYYGAEYCPFCATERWAIVLALSKFGTWNGLRTMASWSGNGEIWPDTPTFTFLHATYTSKYFTFNTYETETRQEPPKPLQVPPANVNRLFTTYAYHGGIPLVYLDGKYVINEVQYNPALLHDNHGQSSKGITFTQALASIQKQTSPLAANIDAAAGSIDADICHITHGQPAAVCKHFPKPITSPDITPGDTATNTTSG